MRNIVLRVLIIAFGVLVLSSCSSNKSKGAGAAGTGTTATTGATAMGMGLDEGFSDNSADANKLRAPYNQVYYFDFNSDTVHQDDVDSMNAQCAYLVAHPDAKIRLEGNTDERGSREYNVALGWRRAKAVANLMEQQGVSPKQIVMVSYGEEKPADLGHNEQSYNLNRRVNLVYEAK